MEIISKLTNDFTRADLGCGRGGNLFRMSGGGAVSAYSWAAMRGQQPLRREVGCFLC